MSDWEQVFEKISDREEITLTKGQVKELMKDAALEAVAMEKQKQKQEQEQQTGLTREQIMQTKDGSTRRKLIRENMNLFKDNLH